MLKLYKRTILICTAIMWTSFVASLLLELFGSNILHRQFAINCLLGIACSSFIVIVTTYLQYSAEHKRIVEEISKQLRELFFRISLLKLSFEDNQIEYESSYWDDKFEGLSQQFDKINHLFSDFCCLDIREKRKFNELYRKMALVWANFEKSRFNSHTTAIENVLNCSVLCEAIDAVIAFSKDEFDKKDLADSKQALK